MPTVEDALALREQGISVVPCDPDKRFPTLAWKPYQEAIASELQVREWWDVQPDANIAIITGSVSDLTVIDIDGPDGIKAMAVNKIELPDTRAVKSPHGWHAWYRYTSDLKTGTKVIPSIDIKNDGACICAPPSSVEAGSYVFTTDLPIAVLDIDLSLFQARRGASDPAFDSWIAKALRQGAPVGERNAQGAKLAGYLHSRGIPDDISEAILIGWAERCVPPLPVRELEGIIKSVGRYARRQSLDEAYGSEL
jgi:hypothetical protein